MLTLPAPAKVNLFLHINGKRADGYHDLETMFQLLDYGDALSFSPIDSGAIELKTNIPEIENDENLVVKAAKMMQKLSEHPTGIKINLHKNLPMGGGVGGGSSDAATTLLGLNHLWKSNLGIEKLANIGLELGADVPVFVRGFTGFAKGVGEDLLPVQIPEYWYLVVTPQVLVSTGKIFTHPELTRDTAAIKIPPLAGERAGKCGNNDCLEVVEMLYPEVAEARSWMQQFSPSYMTGTGASVFSQFATELEAKGVASKVPSRWHKFVARGVNQSPVHEKLFPSN